MKGPYRALLYKGSPEIGLAGCIGVHDGKVTQERGVFNSFVIGNITSVSKFTVYTKNKIRIVHFYTLHYFYFSLCSLVLCFMSKVRLLVQNWHLSHLKSPLSLEISSFLALMMSSLD